MASGVDRAGAGTTENRPGPTARALPGFWAKRSEPQRAGERRFFSTSYPRNVGTAPPYILCPPRSSNMCGASSIKSPAEAL
jgi:hypothetical protein